MEEEIDKWASNPTVDEMIEALQEVKEEHGGDTTFWVYGKGSGTKLVLDDGLGAGVTTEKRWDEE